MPNPAPFLWETDDELVEISLRELYTPVVGDILHACVRYHQFLPQPEQPVKKAKKDAVSAMRGRKGGDAAGENVAV